MHIFTCIVFFVLSEAQQPDPIFDDEAPSPVQRKVDVYPDSVVEAVPFGHIFREGFGDPFSPVKQPVDALELRMRMPKNEEEAKQYLKLGRKHIAFINPEITNKFASAKEAFLREMMLDLGDPPETNETHLKWFDFASMQSKNAQVPPNLQFAARRKEETNHRRHSSRVPTPVDLSQKLNSFSKASFELEQDKRQSEMNWTTCDQFAVGAIFSPKEIVNIRWTPFYIWSDNGITYSIEHVFKFPSKKIVNEYFTNYNKFLNKTIDWSKPKLLMKGMSEMLLIAVDKKGLFDAIVKHEVPKSAETNPITIPSLSLRLKIEDPYLMMMFCEDHLAMLMAISGRQPTTFKDIKAEAATIKFQGNGRPVWRNYEGEAENMKLVNEAIMNEERDKFIEVNAPAPDAAPEE
uniref:SFRICE_033188 n=1 Tax=Spodoptera frugiperda TaxID=7108 RepID=A0A2H1W178_SPOFR